MYGMNSWCVLEKKVIKARRDFIHQLGTLSKNCIQKLSEAKENISDHDPDTEENELEAAVRGRDRPQDMKQKTTLAGPTGMISAL